MTDGVDWPVVFLGALYAGVVPVAVSTLLTADDYAFLLADSGAVAVVASGAVVETLAAAVGRSAHGVEHTIVAGPRAPLPAGARRWRRCSGPPLRVRKAAATKRDDVAFWLYSSGSTERPKGTLHTHANPYWTAQLYGRNVLGIREDDVVLSAAKLFFAYGPRQRLDVSAGGRRDGGPDGRAADAGACSRSGCETHRPTISLRRADALCRAPGVAEPAGARGHGAPALLVGR